MKELDQIVSDVLNINVRNIDHELTRESDQEWDSFNHLLLCSVIEKTMHIKFTMQEVVSIKSLSGLEEAVLKKRKWSMS